MTDLYIRFQEVAGDSAVVEIVTRKCHPTVTELERLLASTALRVVISERWLSRAGYCQCLYVRDQYERPLVPPRSAEIFALLLTALEPRPWESRGRRRRRRRDLLRADYLT
jgi:hypothetical protein